MLKHRRTIFAVFGFVISLAMVGNFALCYLCQDDCADVLFCSDACCHCACAVQATPPAHCDYRPGVIPLGDAWMTPTWTPAPDFAFDLDRPPRAICV